LGKTVLGTVVLGDKSKSLETISLENKGKSFVTTILADKDMGI
jgi:hypothetical protein